MFFCNPGSRVCLLNKNLPQSSQPDLRAVCCQQAGVGTSMMDFEMARDGYTSILGLDYSEGAIAAMMVAHEQLPGVIYRVADCR